MTISRFQLILSGAVVLMLTACGQPVNRSNLETKSHFWQRVDASSALYLQGPKAQQILSRDLSRCVTEIRELERLGAIRIATPGDTTQDGKVPDPSTPEGELAQWETPERDGMLKAEHLDYHDFRTCMMSRGWERVEHVPYEVADRAREIYAESVLGQRYRTKTRQRSSSPVSKPVNSFDNLND